MNVSGVYMAKAKYPNLKGINPRKEVCVHLVVERENGDTVVREYFYGAVFRSIGACEREYDVKRLRNNRRKTLWNSVQDEYVEQDGTVVRYWYIGHVVDEDCSVVSE